jgi:hypothetical protein
MTYILSAPKHLETWQAPPIPLWIEVGYAMYALHMMGLPVNDADDTVYANLQREYVRELERRERLLAWQPRPEKSLHDHKSHFEKCVIWIMERMYSQTFLSYIHPGKGKAATDKPRRIAEIVSDERDNPGVTDQHVREAQRRVRGKAA